MAMEQGPDAPSKELRAWGKGFSARSEKAEIKHFVAKNLGVYSIGQDAVLALWRIPAWAQAKDLGDLHLWRLSSHSQSHSHPDQVLGTALL